jgi:hypothetical protein
MSRNQKAARKACLVVLLASAWFLVAAVPAGADRPKLPGDDQARVTVAINKGVAYLSAVQGKDGSWNGHVGHTSLAALALLESEVNPRDPQIQKAAAFVRSKWATIDATYDLALAILFLDKLSDPKEKTPKDRALIQTFALRLIAGQTTTGGWSYKCPILTPEQHRSLFATLEKLRLQDAKENFQGLMGEPSGSPGGGKTDKQPAISTGDKPSADQGPGGGRFSKSDAAVGLGRMPRRGFCIKMAEDSREEQTDGPAPKPADKDKPRPGGGRVVIPPQLKSLPVLQDADKLGVHDPRDTPDSPITGEKTTDNSNTQFAILGLWAAQRHGVPMERSLRLIVNRFRTSQGAEGGWAYGYAKGGAGSAPAMSCAGLIGLAVGYGLASNAKAKPGAPKQQVPDKLLLRGFRYLVKQIGDPTGKMHDVAIKKEYNFYFLWSVERVGVLYNLATIGRKDWYRWGAEILVANQVQDGSWPKGGEYPGDSPVINSCFALLFLRGANLASDLTDKLPFNAKELTEDIEATTPPPPVITQPPPKKDPVDPVVPPAKDKGGKPDGQIESPKSANPDQGQLGSVNSPNSSSTPTSSSKSEKDSDNTWLLIAAIAGGLVLLLGGAGLGVFLWTRNGKKDKERPRKRRRRDEEDGDDTPRPSKRKSSKAIRDSGN